MTDIELLTLINTELQNMNLAIAQLNTTANILLSVMIINIFIEFWETIKGWRKWIG